MQNSLAVAVFESVNQLLEYRFCYFFFQLSSFSYVRQQITTRGQFDNKQDVFLSFEVLEKPDNVAVPCLLQDHDLLHDFFRL